MSLSTSCVSILFRWRALLVCAENHRVSNTAKTTALKHFWCKVVWSDEVNQNKLHKYLCLCFWHVLLRWQNYFRWRDVHALYGEFTHWSSPPFNFFYFWCRIKIISSSLIENCLCSWLYTKVVNFMGCSEHVLQKKWLAVPLKLA